MNNKIIDKTKETIKIIFYYVCWLLPIKKNRIVADNFNGSFYGDNAGAIIDKLLEKEKDLDIYWAYSQEKMNDINLPKGVKKVKFGSVKHYYILATSKIWIDNVRIPLRIWKRKKQFYLQTWHAGFGFKRIEKDVEDVLTKKYIKSAKRDSKNISLIITNSNWEADYFRECFYYDGEMIRTGLPRCDELFDKSKYSATKKKVHNYYNIPMNEKIVLYAPTFRDDKNVLCYDIDYERLVSNLKKKTKQNWKVVLRLHPNIADMNLQNIEGKNVINASKYDSLNELMISSDLLITDYSSLAFEFSYLSKPIIIYASDIEKYEKGRGFLWKFKDLPFPFSKNNKELEKCISNFSKVEYLKDLNAFYEKHGLLEDGKASERVAKIIINKMKG